MVCTGEPEEQNERDDNTETMKFGHSAAQNDESTVASTMVCSVQNEPVDQTASSKIGVSAANPAEPTNVRCKSKIENKHTGNYA